MVGIERLRHFAFITYHFDEILGREGSRDDLT